ncbi:MAG: outer membrane beta-barrel protein [Myxococcaceae bacterium]
MKRTVLAAAVALGMVASSAMAATHYEERKDTSVFVKGGIGGYTGGLSDFTAAGPVWGVGVDLSPMRALGIELNYDGSRNALTDNRIAGSEAALRNGASAMLKIAPPLIDRIKPYIGAGLGASYVSIQGDGQGLYRNDLMEEVPLAAGLDFNSGALTAGFRAGYNILVDQGFADNAQANGNPNGSLIHMAATLGGRF